MALSKVVRGEGSWSKDPRQLAEGTLPPTSEPRFQSQEEYHQDKEIWVPEPDGKLCSTLIFRWGLQLQVEGEARDVSRLLDEAVEENDQVTFINPYFGTPVIVRHPEEVMAVNTDWADLEQIKLAQERVKAAKIEARKAALGEAPKQGFRKSR